MKIRFKMEANTLYGLGDVWGSFLRNKRNKFVFDYIKGKLLDVSCGDNLLVKGYSNGIGVDIVSFSDDVIVVKSTDNLPFKNETFDTVTNIAALNYATNPQETLIEMKRVLTCDGVLLISMPNYYALRIWRLLRREDIEFRAIKRKNLRSLINQAGLKLIMEKRFLLGMNVLYIIKKND